MLTGKIALVTGGSRGIGAATAATLARYGADVAVTFVSSSDKAATTVDAVRAAGRTGLAVQADSARPDDVVRAVDETVSRFGGIDILVNNAGIFPYGPLEELTVDEIDHTFAVHVRAALLASQAAARHMNDGGRIVSVGSNLADRVPFPGITLYAASKAALDGMTKGLARDLGPRGITANVVHPGPTDSDMNPADGDGADAQRELAALGRYGTTEDVAETVAHLAGPGGRSITGTSVLVDGGSNA
ncbi:NAD(P)-dependent dehydrogenase (short-subunit alcohol dehydrogenase family) [Haloactinopolyspora alba]|uniref:NAD(P)-dependent dehydrogenase (Short-subunit alcohol dehydrogenase family) n=1 Tax=Haloactinopolyspora alba TaxID=648780 RepID=A0A2P8EGF7_9ACTN|nr:SDR family oxidoreductase [Haloactinopolyspora alba]PSL08556.1 NAD(P)-dependent dehydrogenase (short-subunit alcohol dehydrogenase family) [Haloactinopolyspora alba]